MATTKWKKVRKHYAPHIEFIPGNISIRDWQELLGVEEGVEAVCELVEELAEKASRVVFDHYLEKEAFSYAVQDAKEIILRTLAMEFVGRDDGETDTSTDPTWLQNKAPVPPPIDAWTCGMAPMTSLSSLESLKDAMEPIRVQQSPSSSSQTCQSPLTEKRKVGAPSSSTPERRILSGSSPRSTPTFSKPSLVNRNKVTKTKGRPTARHYRMTLLDRASSEVSDLAGQDGAPEQVGVPSPSPDALNHTPFGLKPVELKRLKGVTHDQHGKIVDMVKLNPIKFPSHRVKPVVSVVQPPTTGPPPPPNLRSKRMKPTTHSPHVTFPSFPPCPNNHDLVDKHTKVSSCLKANPGCYTERGEGMTQEVGEGDTGSVCSHGGRVATVMPSASGVSCEISARRFPEMPMLPNLVDTIDPLPGVTVREGDRSVQGPTPNFPSNVIPCKEMRPLDSLITTNSGDVDERNEKVRRKKKGKYSLEFMSPKTSHPHINVTKVAS